jgi:hypothetical protein
MSDRSKTGRPTSEPTMTPIERIPSAPDSTTPVSAPSTARHPPTIREIGDLIDAGWRNFYAAARSFPSEHMDEHLGEEGWTRKQMLAHITAWHDLTNERISHLLATGKPGVLRQETDVINARVARQAVGRTAGEVLKDMELSYNRLRRQVGRLTDDQLAMHDAWAAAVIAGNTYEHYAEHDDDVHQAAGSAGRGGRR